MRIQESVHSEVSGRGEEPQAGAIPGKWRRKAVLRAWNMRGVVFFTRVKSAKDNPVEI
jgi:hypothetical protein